MALLPLDPDELLTTTRAVRKRLDLDRPLDVAMVQEALAVAVQAPSGSNREPWHFVVVADAPKRARLAELYRQSFDGYRQARYAAGNLYASDPGRQSVQRRVMDSAVYLASILDRVPVHVIPCIDGRIDGAPAAQQAGYWGSLLPAVWSFMLAARARGLGTAYTTLHLPFEREAAELLGIPYEQVTQAALIPVAHTVGTDFKPAARQPMEQVVHVDAW
ncbi:MAG: nitroreductase family protein [Acidimicrobiales bacterium]